MKKLVAALSIVLLFGACSNSEEDKGTKSGHEEQLHMLNVKIGLPFDEIRANANQTFSADVSYGDEVVKDADEVMFEFREKSEEKGKMIIAEHEADGKYVASYTFDKPGEYIITAHVTARSTHNMPSEKVQVVK